MMANKIITERFKILPKSIQDALLSANLPEKLIRTAEKYQLHIDQAGALETETHLVMLGLETPNDYAKNIQKALNISSEIAGQIANDINNEVFLSIRKSLKQLQAQEEETSNVVEQNAIKSEGGISVLNQEQEKENQDSTKLSQVAKQQIEGIPEVTSAPLVRPEQKEDVAPQNLPTGDISSLKLDGAFSVSKEEQNDEVDKRETSKTAEKNYETDPYREPIE